MVRNRLVTLLAAGVLALIGPWTAPAAAVVNCGATLTSSTTLTASDPVTTTMCNDNGLTIQTNADIVLDCAGGTITGDGTGTYGIKVGSGASGAVIKNCVVENFKTGIQITGPGFTTLMRTVAKDNQGNGVSITSNDNVVTDVVSLNNTGHGFETSGANDVTFDGAVAVGNGSRGFSLGGARPVVQNSLAISNGGAGFTHATSTGGSFSANAAVDNGGDGFNIAGGTTSNPKDFDGNRAFVNGGNGLVVTGTNTNGSIDNGGNVGLANVGTTQCQIAGVACQ
jgi:hypothetical protein